MPWLENKLGLLRTGAWSLWSEMLLLIPAVALLFAPPASGVYGDVAFFSALACSRVGLYSFDLVQMQILQITLEHHPRRNRFTALQVSMSSAMDLAKYAVVLVFNRPDQSVFPRLRPRLAEDC